MNSHQSWIRHDSHQSRIDVLSSRCQQYEHIFNNASESVWPRGNTDPKEVLEEREHEWTSIWQCGSEDARSMQIDPARGSSGTSGQREAEEAGQVLDTPPTKAGTRAIGSRESDGQEQREAQDGAGTDTEPQRYGREDLREYNPKS